LNRLCLTRSRNEAKQACDSGAISIAGKPARASQDVYPGDLVTLRFTNRLLEVRLHQVPVVSISKKAAREMYEILRDERVDPL
jgi:ribosomal 50S subunit-recycling heat shock protein